MVFVIGLVELGRVAADLGQHLGLLQLEDGGAGHQRFLPWLVEVVRRLPHPTAWSDQLSCVRGLGAANGVGEAIGDPAIPDTKNNRYRILPER
jgi:hypothetical protein